jgi:LacI family transcriptional regulator
LAGAIEWAKTIKMGQKKKINLQTIAEAAGVSISTASRVLNKSKGRFPIAEKTRDCVLEVARKQGYFPSLSAQALRRGLVNTIGVIETSSSVFQEMGRSLQHYLFISEAMRGIYEAAAEHEYHVMLMSGAEREFEHEIELLGQMGLVDGLLVTNRDLAADPVFTDAMAVYPKPVVYALDYPDNDSANWVAPDDEQGGFLAAKELIERGHRKILFARTVGFDNIFRKRAKGWQRALEEAPQGPADGQLVFAEEGNLARWKEQGFTAVVCANLPSAELVEKALNSEDLSMPDDMEMVVFSSEVSPVLKPLAAYRKWAVVTDPLARIMRESGKMLIDLIKGEEPEIRQISFPYTFLHGRSCPNKRNGTERVALQTY